MNEKVLEKRFDERRGSYSELAEKCGSVSELMFKLEVYGDRWTKWDWVMFLSYLDYESECCDGVSLAWGLYSPQQVDGDGSAKALLGDMFREIDSGSRLDAVLTNRTVLANMIEWLGAKGWGSIPRRKYGLLRLLAHVFRKFPELWTMNWMFIRHRGKTSAGKRTHRLAYTLPMTASRPDRYFGSRAFLDDFVSRFWCERGSWVEEGVK